MELALPGAAVAIAGLASHAFHSWLKVRSRAMLEQANVATITQAHNDLLAQFEKHRLDVKNYMANNRGR
jgi:hypothetical protein